MKEEKFPHNRKSSHSLGQWGTLESQRATLPKEKKLPQNSCKLQLQQRSSSDAHSHQQQVGAGHGGTGYINGPEDKDQA